LYLSLKNCALSLASDVLLTINCSLFINLVHCQRAGGGYAPAICTAVRCQFLPIIQTSLHRIRSHRMFNVPVLLIDLPVTRLTRTSIIVEFSYSVTVSIGDLWYFEL